MSVDDRYLPDWAELSYDEVITSTMTQSKSQRKTITPLRRMRVMGKNLSRSFSMIDEELKIFDENSGTTRKSVNFYRTDSGFNDGTDHESKPENEHMMDVSMRSNF